ncbi:dNA polymerase subunits gamma and tau [Sutterella sp. CAG:521]|nr:dNA polymerase subunits gamma and tau [Sutterella sp. CAG:521]
MGFSFSQITQKLDEHVAVHHAQHFPHTLESNRFIARKSDGLIEQTQTVTHRASGPHAQKLQSGGFGLNIFFLQNVCHMFCNGLRRNILQIKLQTTRQNRNRNFLRICRCQNKFHIFGRLFERFQHGVESVRSELMHFVNHVDFVAGVGRRIHCLLEQRGHLLDRAVARRVHFNVINETPFINGTTRFTNSARMIRHPAFTVRSYTIKAFSQNS